MDAEAGAPQKVWENNSKDSQISGFSGCYSMTKVLEEHCFHYSEACTEEKAAPFPKNCNNRLPVIAGNVSRNSSGIIGSLSITNDCIYNGII